MTDVSSVTRVVSVISGKGGVGKSVVALNLAERLAAGGFKVLLVDADANCGNLHILANVSGEYGLREFVRGELSLVEAVTTTPNGFDLLAAGGGEMIWTEADVVSVAGIVARLRRDGSCYDLILMDHASGVSKAATVMAHASDMSILLLVPELTSISDCYGLYKHLKDIDDRLDCRLLVNRAGSPEEATYIHSKLCAISERFLGHAPTYLAYLPESNSLGESIARQSPVSALSTESDIVQELTSTASRLAAILFPARREKFISQLNHINAINKTAALADIRE